MASVTDYGAAGDPRSGATSLAAWAAAVSAALDGDDTTVDARITAAGTALSDALPADLGTAAAGAGTAASRDDHVHDMPTAADVGAAATSHTHAPGDVTGTAVITTDSRLSDARTPTAHKTSHATGGSDALAAADIGAAATSHNHAATDLTSGTVATARLGTGTADGTTFLRGDQTWAAAGGSSYVGAQSVSIPHSSNPGVPFAVQVDQSTVVCGGGRNYGYLFVVPVAISVTALHILVNVAATTGGALGRLGLYTVASVPTSDTAVNCSNVRDAGTVAIDSTGQKTATFGSAQSLAPGIYAPVIAVNDTVTLGAAGVVGGATQPGLTIVSNNWRTLRGLSYNLNGTTYVASGLPSTMTLGVGAFTASTYGGQEAMIAMNWSYA